MKIETHFISDIHESEYNPRVALDRFSKEYKAIQKSIEDYGFVEPVVVNETTMTCIGGHQRLAVMRDMGAESIDCVMVHIDSSEKEKALCVALNKIKGEWDNEKLDELLHDDEITAFELGFENVEVNFDDDFSGDEADADDCYDLGDDEVGESSAADETVPEATMVVKIDNYHFDVTTSEYEELIGSIRDKGIFEKSEIIEELRRKLRCD